MAVNIHITIIELNALHTKRQNLFQELDAVIHLLMEAKHWGLRKSRNARSEERFSRNAETDLVCRLLLEKKTDHSTQARAGSRGGNPRSATVFRPSCVARRLDGPSLRSEPMPVRSGAATSRTPSFFQ